MLSPPWLTSLVICRARHASVTPFAYPFAWPKTGGTIRAIVATQSSSRSLGELGAPGARCRTRAQLGLPRLAIPARRTSARDLAAAQRARRQTPRAAAARGTRSCRRAVRRCSARGSAVSRPGHPRRRGRGHRLRRAESIPAGSPTAGCHDRPPSAGLLRCQARPPIGLLGPRLCLDRRARPGRENVR